MLFQFYPPLIFSTCVRFRKRTVSIFLFLTCSVTCISLCIKSITCLLSLLYEDTMEAIDPLERLHKAVGVGWGRAGSTASTEGLALGLLGFFDVKLHGLVMLRYQVDVMLYCMSSCMRGYSLIFSVLQCMIVDVYCVLWRFYSLSRVAFQGRKVCLWSLCFVSAVCLSAWFCLLFAFGLFCRLGMSECRNVNVKNWWTFGMPWRSECTECPFMPEMHGARGLWRKTYWRGGKSAEPSWHLQHYDTWCTWCKCKM